MTDTDDRRAALMAELAALDTDDDNTAEAVAEVAAETVEAVAEAVADVVTSAAPEPVQLDPLDPIDVAAADSLRIEAETASRVAIIEAEAAAAVTVAQAATAADVEVIEALPDVGPPPESDTAPRADHWFFRGLNK